jgi:predicted aspartyl protease
MRELVACDFEGDFIVLPFRIKRSGDDSFSEPMKGVIDTGYNGYIRMPLAEAIRLKLSLRSMGAGSLANGAKEVHLNTTAWAAIPGHSAEAVIDSSLEDGPREILVGEKMLSAWKVTLEADYVRRTARLLSDVL